MVLFFARMYTLVKSLVESQMKMCVDLACANVYVLVSVCSETAFECCDPCSML